MGFRLVPKLVTLNDPEERNGLILRYFTDRDTRHQQTTAYIHTRMQLLKRDQNSRLGTLDQCVCIFYIQDYYHHHHHHRYDNDQSSGSMIIFITVDNHFSCRVNSYQCNCHRNQIIIIVVIIVIIILIIIITKFVIIIIIIVIIIITACFCYYCSFPSVNQQNCTEDISTNWHKLSPHCARVTNITW